jgi:hypothetical protein
MNKFHEIEIEKLFEMILSIENFRLQAGIFLATSNLGVLGYAVTQEKIILFFFGAILFLLLIPLDIYGRRGLVGCYYRLSILHRKYVRSEKDYLPNMFSATAQEVKRILALSDDKDKMRRLRSAPWRVNNLLGFWLPVIASIIEIVTGTILWKIMGWSLF